MASEPKMTDQDKRDLCEAVGWEYHDDICAIRGDGMWRAPFHSNVADAIAALEAWRAKHGGWWEMLSPDETSSDWVATVAPKVGCAVDGHADTLPAAACRAILAAWRKMKESK